MGPAGPTPEGLRVRGPGALRALPVGPPRPRLPGRKLPGFSGTSAPRPPLASGWPRPPPAAWPLGRSGFARPFGAPLASSLARWLGLSARGACASLGGRSPRGAAPAGAASAPAPPPSAGFARGLSVPCAWPALRASAASLRGWSALGLSGLGPARPAPPRVPLGPPRRLRAAGSSPCGARPGSLRPGGGAARWAASDGFAAPGAWGTRCGALPPIRRHCC